MRRFLVGLLATIGGSCVLLAVGGRLWSLGVSRRAAAELPDRGSC